MNLPNKLTLLRAVLIIPVAVLTLLAPSTCFWLWLAAGLCFAAAAITDAIDGNLARRHNMVTDFGKLMDPVADKLLVTTVLVCFLAIGICPAWVLIVVLAREFLVTSIRMVATSKGMVIAANAWGKMKTIFQMTAIGVAYAAEFACSLLKGTELLSGRVMDIVEQSVYWSEQALFIAAAIVTVVSGAVYAVQSKQLFADVK